MSSHPLDKRTQRLLEARTIAAGFRAGRTHDDLQHALEALEELVAKFARDVRRMGDAESVVDTLRTYGAMIQSLGANIGWAIDDPATFEREIDRTRYAEMREAEIELLNAEKYRLTGYEENPV